jgi:hypothetical protein
MHEIGLQGNGKLSVNRNKKAWMAKTELFMKGEAGALPEPETGIGNPGS